MAFARVDADVTAYTARRYEITQDKVLPVFLLHPFLSLVLGSLLNRLSKKHQLRRLRFSISSQTISQILRSRAKEDQLGRGRGVNHARAATNPGRSRRGCHSGENGKSRRGQRVRGSAKGKGKLKEKKGGGIVRKKNKSKLERERESSRRWNEEGERERKGERDDNFAEESRYASALGSRINLNIDMTLQSGPCSTERR